GGRIEIVDEGDYLLDFVSVNAPLRFKGMVRVYAGPGVTERNVVFRPAGGPGTGVRLRANRLHFDGDFTFRMDEITQIDPTGGAGTGDQEGYILWHDGNFFDSTNG